MSILHYAYIQLPVAHSKYVNMSEEMLVPGEEDSHREVTLKNKTVSKTSRSIICLSVSVVLIILLSAAVIGLAVALGVTLNNKSDVSEVCTTRQCAETAAFILQGLNESVDPCEDFYQFSCGNWMRSNNVDPGELE